MGEIDRFIINSLRQIGCEIDDEITRIKQFDFKLIVKAVVSCLDLIKPTHGIPKKLPCELFQKYRIGHEIAVACSNLGYAEKLGFKMFLNADSPELIKILQFLINKAFANRRNHLSETSSSSYLDRIQCKKRDGKPRPRTALSCYNLSDCSITSEKFSKETFELALKQILTKGECEYIDNCPLSKPSSKHELTPQDSLHDVKDKEALFQELVNVIKNSTLDFASEIEEQDAKSKDQDPLLKEEEMNLTTEVEKLIYDVVELQLKRNHLASVIRKERNILTKKYGLGVKLMEILMSNPEKEELEEKFDLKTDIPVCLGDKLNTTQVNSNLTVKSSNKVPLGKHFEEVCVERDDEREKAPYTAKVMEILRTIDQQKSEIGKVLKASKQILTEASILSDKTCPGNSSEKKFPVSGCESDEINASRKLKDPGNIMKEICELENEIARERSRIAVADLEKITADLNQIVLKSLQLEANRNMTT